MEEVVKNVANLLRAAWLAYMRVSQEQDLLPPVPHSFLFRNFHHYNRKKGREKS